MSFLFFPSRFSPAKVAWSARSSLCVTLGTSLCGMTSDEIPRATAEALQPHGLFRRKTGKNNGFTMVLLVPRTKFHCFPSNVSSNSKERFQHGQGEGLVIIGLQRTFYDEDCWFCWGFYRV